MSTTSVPCPCAAAFSRADRSASALVTSISSGAATTGTPLTTSKDDMRSPTYVVSQHVNPSQLLKRGARSGRHEMKWAVTTTVHIQGHSRPWSALPPRTRAPLVTAQRAFCLCGASGSRMDREVQEQPLL